MIVASTLNLYILTDRLGELVAGTALKASHRLHVQSCPWSVYSCLQRATAQRSHWGGEMSLLVPICPGHYCLLPLLLFRQELRNALLEPVDRAAALHLIQVRINTPHRAAPRWGWR